MERPRLKRNDVLLVLLAVVVVAGAVYTVKQGSAVPQGEDILSAPATPAPATPAPATPASTTPDPVVASPTASTPFTFVAPSGTATVRRRVVLLGEDLTDPVVVSKVADTLGTPVFPAPSTASTPLPSAVYVDLLPGPGIVVIQLPRASTSRRDAMAAVADVQRRSPGTKVVLVGPLRTGQSYGGALKALAGVGSVTYLDPIAEQWVTPTPSAPLTGGQRLQLAAHLAQDLTPLLT